MTLWYGADEIRKANMQLSSHGISVVDLQQSIDSIKNKYGLFGAGDYIHFNSKGKYVIASAVCQHVVASNWPQERRRYDMLSVVNDTVFN